MCGAFTSASLHTNIIDKVCIVVLSWSERSVGCARGRWNERDERLIARGTGACCVVPGPFETGAVMGLESHGEVTDDADLAGLLRLQ